MWKEFREFIAKGNVLDLAVGIIIGAAFGKIVTSLVNDIIMPLIGLSAGRINFSNLFLALDFNSYENLEAAKKAGAPVLMYGNFIQAILDFLLVGFAIFMIIKAANRVRAAATPAQEPLPAATVATKQCAFCLSQIPLGAIKCAYCCSEQSTTHPL